MRLVAIPTRMIVMVTDYQDTIFHIGSLPLLALSALAQGRRSPCQTFPHQRPRSRLTALRLALYGHRQQHERSVPMKDFTNADRAKRSKAALKRYNGDNDTITNAVDLLTDLQHF